MHPMKANAFMLCWLLYNIATQILISLLYLQLQNTPYTAFFNSPWFAVVSQVICFILPLAVWLLVSGEKLKNVVPNRKLGVINTALILGLCLCLQPLMMLLSALTSLLFPNNVAGVLSDWQDIPLGVLLIVMALTPAICEEITFRGYILSHLGGAGIKKAALVCGLFFGIMHLDPQQFLYAFVMGIIFAYLVFYTRSIRAGILAHGCVNAFQLLLNYWLMAVSANEPMEEGQEAAPLAGVITDSAQESTTISPEASTFPTDFAQETLPLLLSLSLIALAFLPLVIYLFRTILQYNRHRNSAYDLLSAVGLPASLSTLIKVNMARQQPDSDEKPIAPVPFYSGEEAIEMVHADSEEKQLVPLPSETDKEPIMPLPSEPIKTPWSYSLFSPLFWAVILIYVFYVIFFLRVIFYI